VYQLYHAKPIILDNAVLKYRMSAWEDNIYNVLETLDGFVKGKSNIGLSNENPWGIMRFLEESKYNTKSKTIQNPYSLLNRLLKTVLLKFA
jgi:aryl-alcohol dehydrogenase-like predicted oxidoreductase